MQAHIQSFAYSALNISAFTKKLEKAYAVTLFPSDNTFNKDCVEYSTNNVSR